MITESNSIDACSFEVFGLFILEVGNGWTWCTEICVFGFMIVCLKIGGNQKSFFTEELFLNQSILRGSDELGGSRGLCMVLMVFQFLYG